MQVLFHEFSHRLVDLESTVSITTLLAGKKKGWKWKNIIMMKKLLPIGHRQPASKVKKNNTSIEVDESENGRWGGARLICRKRQGDYYWGTKNLNKGEDNNTTVIGEKETYVGSDEDITWFVKFVFFTLFHAPQAYLYHRPTKNFYSLSLSLFPFIVFIL